MNSEQYQPTLDAMQLMGELRRLLVAQRRADRLICRYLADLSDGMDNYSAFVLVYADVCDLVHARLRLSFRAIRERIRVGKALRTLPLIDAALMAGDLTYSKVREVTRVARPENERLWLEAARRLPMRALERSVAKANRAARGQAHAPSGIEPAPEASSSGVSAPQVPASPLLDVPAEVLALLQQAMQSARIKSERVLTDAEALAEVARAAMVQFATSSSIGGSPEVATHEAATHEAATHSGSSSEHSNERPTVDRPAPNAPVRPGHEVVGHCIKAPSLGRSEAAGSEAPPPQNKQPSTHSGSATATPDRRGPLTDDAQLLLTVIRSRDCWYPDTLQEITALPEPRFTTALFDLLCRHLVLRGPTGLFEAPKAGLKRAG